MLAFSWDHIGVMLGSFWHHAGTNEFHPKCCGADFGSRIKISGNLLGQNDQNLEIYAFDWSQVASWGLAAKDQDQGPRPSDRTAWRQNGLRQIGVRSETKPEVDQIDR